MACWIACLIYVFKNWKLLFKNIYKNICWWKNMWKYIKYCLKTENDCLKTQTKHPPEGLGKDVVPALNCVDVRVTYKTEALTD